MEGDFLLLKYSSNTDNILQFLLTNKWKTRPDMTIGWIIKNIDNLYYLIDFKDTEKYIGFMVYNHNIMLIDYFELLPEYRNKGYGTNIIKNLNVKKVSVSIDDTKAIKFWNKFDKVKIIHV